MTKYEWVKEVDTAALETQRAQKEAEAAKAEAAAILHERTRYERAQKEAEEEAKRDAIQAELDRAQRMADAKWIAETRTKSTSDNYLWLACNEMPHDQRIELFELLQATRNQYLVLQSEANAK